MNEYDKIYIRKWGSSDNYSELPYQVYYYDGNTLTTRNTIPEHDVSQNDVDLDAYTNTAGYTIRNRVRHDVTSLDIKVPTMMGYELRNFFSMTRHVWLQVKYFDESEWAWVEKKMYRSGTVTYHKYYIDRTNPLNNIYTDVSFSLIEQ